MTDHVTADNIYLKPLTKNLSLKFLRNIKSTRCCRRWADKLLWTSRLNGSRESGIVMGENYRCRYRCPSTWRRNGRWFCTGVAKEATSFLTSPWFSAGGRPSFISSGTQRKFDGFEPRSIISGQWSDEWAGREFELEPLRDARERHHHLLHREFWSDGNFIRMAIPPLLRPWLCRMCITRECVISPFAVWTASEILRVVVIFSFRWIRDNEEEIIVIEINPRVSRSSALVSKATIIHRENAAVGHRVSSRWIKKSDYKSTSAFLNQLSITYRESSTLNFDV